MEGGFKSLWRYRNRPVFPVLYQTTKNIPEITINTFLCLLCNASFSSTIPESAVSATQGVVGAEQWGTFQLLRDKESAYACLHLDGKTTAVTTAVL